MAVTNEVSDQLDNVAAVPPVMNPSYDEGGKLRSFYFHFVQGAAAGDATSTATLVHIPPGKWRIFLPLSVIQWTAFGASRVLDVGYAAHTNADGTAVTADPDSFDNDIDVSSAGQAALGSDFALGTGDTLEIDSKDGVDILATVAGGTIPAAAVLSGFIVAARD